MSIGAVCGLQFPNAGFVLCAMKTAPAGDVGLRFCIFGLLLSDDGPKGEEVLPKEAGNGKNNRQSL